MENIFSNDQCNDRLNFSEISLSSEIWILNAQDIGGPLCIYTIKVCKGSAIEDVLYFKCQRKYYNGSATENADLDIFCDTCLQWEFPNGIL